MQIKRIALIPRCCRHHFALLEPAVMLLVPTYRPCISGRLNVTGGSLAILLTTGDLVPQPGTASLLLLFATLFLVGIELPLRKSLAASLSFEASTVVAISSGIDIEE